MAVAPSGPMGQNLLHSPLLVLAVGVAGTVIGVGVGLRWLGAGVIAWQSMVGVLALLLGVAGLAFGLTRLGRRLSGWIRVPTTAFVLLLVVLVVWSLVPAVIATQVPPLERGATPADFGFEAADVRFVTVDGVELAGWFVPPASGITVIVRHGSGSTSSSVLAHARVLVDSGFGVLVTDARGHGDSGGKAMEFGWYGESDIEAAISFLAGQPTVDAGRIGVLGLSMGGEEAIGATAVDGRIAAVVTEGASARSEGDKAWLPDVYGWRGRVQVWLEWVQYSVTDLLTRASKPMSLADAAASGGVPILMIAAGERPDEIHAARYVQAASPSTVSIWTVAGAGHVSGLMTAPDEWEARVVQFFTTAIAD